MDERKKETYCLKPISEADGCKDFCHPNFRTPCLERFEKYTNGELFKNIKEDSNRNNKSTD